MISETQGIVAERSPTQIVQLLAQVTDAAREGSAVDPACGSSSFLLQAAQRASWKGGPPEFELIESVLTHGQLDFQGTRLKTLRSLYAIKLADGCLLIGNPPYRVSRHKGASSVRFTRTGQDHPSGFLSIKQPVRFLDIASELTDAGASSSNSEFTDSRIQDALSCRDPWSHPWNAEPLNNLAARPHEKPPATALSRTDRLDVRRCRRAPRIPNFPLALFDNLPPRTSVAPPLLSEVPAIIKGWTDLSETKRRDLLSAVRWAVRIDVTPDPRPALNPSPPQPATMSCGYLNTRLFRQAHAIYGIATRENFSNILNRIRFILRRLDLHEPPYAGSHTLHHAWRRLHDALRKQRRISLSGFVRFCSMHAIATEAVTTETLVAFETWLLERTLCNDAPERARRVASNWTWARAHVPGWPDVELKRPRMREHYSLPFTAYPASLQEDVQQYLDHLGLKSLDDIFPDDADQPKKGRTGLPRPLRPRTIAGRKSQLQQCLGALVKLGHPPASLTSLQSLVQPPERAKAIMQFFLDRARNRRTSQTGQIGELLRQLAKYLSNLSDAGKAQVALWARRAAPDRRQEISEKNALRVRALLQPEMTKAFLSLPELLMREAANPELSPREAALLAMYAAALAILLTFPMRRSNLVQLHLGRHLQRLDPKRKLITHILLPGVEHKTRNAMLWPIKGTEASRVLERYLKDYRPTLAQPGNLYLFPDTKMGYRSAGDLAVGLKKIVETRIGCEFNLHLVRHFVIALFLKHNPGQYEVARKLLGHSATSYTIGFYAPLEVDAAARSLDQALKTEHLAERPSEVRRARARRKTKVENLGCSMLIEQLAKFAAAANGGLENSCDIPGKGRR